MFLDGEIASLLFFVIGLYSTSKILDSPVECPIFDTKKSDGNMFDAIF